MSCLEDFEAEEAFALGNVKTHLQREPGFAQPPLGVDHEQAALDEDRVDNETARGNCESSQFAC